MRDYYFTDCTGNIYIIPCKDAYEAERKGYVMGLCFVGRDKPKADNT